MAALQERVDDIEFVGVGGDTMHAQGLRSLAPMDHFAVNGLVDPLLRAWPLIRLLRMLIRELASVDVLVGVDFNVFNLLLETGVRKRGVATAHYVSPSVYAWRRGRLKRIAKASDVVMTLFPFETAVYEERGLRAEFVGHPTADLFDPDIAKEQLQVAARQTLGLVDESFVLCVMPGSRSSEIKFHFEVFLQAAKLFQEQARIPVTALVPTKHPVAHESWAQLKDDFASLNVELTDAPATQVLQASDLALVKSGTGTLEAMLVKTPMVVAYRIGALTYRIVRAMMYSDYIALPNILANKSLVPEFIQTNATAENLAAALIKQRNRDQSELVQEFSGLHRTLRTNAAARAAETVLSLIT